ncbi:protein kinase domain-containing protein [Pendulispora rubella]
MRIGTTIRGKYRVDRLLRVGGMAAVYAATDRRGHRVAVKFLLERFADDPDILQLFDREAHAANQVNHPGAVPVLDHGVDENGAAFLVMPLLEGETLRERWERAGKSLPVAEVAVFMSDVLAVLASAHARGVIHRDIKPENLFVTRAGEVRVLDFGVARRVDDDGSATMTGRMMGTPAFMPPEQARGDRHAVGPHSDCWSTGATMFTLLSGTFVHEGGASAQLAATMMGHARSLAEVAPALPPVIVQFVDKALAFEPKDRWPTAEDMRHALHEAFTPALGEAVDGLAERVRERVVSELASGGDEDAEATRAPARVGPRREKISLWKGLLAGGVVLGLATATVFATREPPPKGEANPASGSIDPAIAHLRAGLQNWHDGSVRAAQEEFDRVIALDRGSAAAHLYSALLFEGEDVMREHLGAALAQREGLGMRDRALLEALTDVRTVPWNVNATAERMLSVAARFPSDWAVQTSLAALQTMAGNARDALAVLDGVLREDPKAGIAWFDESNAFASLGDAKSARGSLEECLRSSPDADGCLDNMIQIDLREGQCAESERTARKLMATSLPPRSWGASLVDSIYGRGGTMESVQSVIEQEWRLAPPAERESTRLRSKAVSHVLTGDFATVAEALAAWDEEVANRKYEEDHAMVAKLRFYLAMELGDRPLTARLAAQYLSRREAWLASSYYDWEIVPLRIQYLAGGLSREAFQARRKAWLTRTAATHQPLRNESNTRWIEAYAFAAITHADAVDALRALPESPPTFDALRTDVGDDLAMGRVYFLAGETEKALPYLRHGARSCQALRFPFEHTWIHLQLGESLERAGDPSGACGAYGIVLSRWGKDPRSVSARAARLRWAALRCVTAPHE